MTPLLAAAAIALLSLTGALEENCALLCRELIECAYERDEDTADLSVGVCVRSCVEKPPGGLAHAVDQCSVHESCPFHTCVERYLEWP